MSERAWVCLWCHAAGLGVLPFLHWKGDCVGILADLAAACDEARAATQRAFEPETVSLEEVRRLNAIAAALGLPTHEVQPRTCESVVALADK